MTVTTFPELCDHCKQQKAEYIMMLEDDENPHKTVTKKVCAKCLTHYQGYMIECWSYLEWLNDE